MSENLAFKGKMVRFGLEWFGLVWFGFLCFCSLRWSLLAYVPNLSSLCALCVLQLILLCVVPTFKMCDIHFFFFFFVNGVRSRTLPIVCMGSFGNYRRHTNTGYYRTIKKTLLRTYHRMWGEQHTTKMQNRTPSHLLRRQNLHAPFANHFPTKNLLYF